MFILNSKISITTQQNRQSILLPASPSVNLSDSYMHIPARKEQLIVLDNVHDVKVVTSLDTLTDTCTIRIATKYNLKYGKGIMSDAKSIRDVIQEGDAIEVKLGYGRDEKELNRVFTGYITNIAKKDEYEKDAIAKRFIEITCENNAWRLKHAYFEANYLKGLTIKTFAEQYIKPIFKDLPLDHLPDFNIGNINLDAADSVAKVLDFLGQKHNIYFFFNLDSFNAILSNNTSYQKDKTPINLKVGEDIIDNTLKLQSGTLTAFGEFFIIKGDRIIIQDDENPSYAKKNFLVKGVTYKFGMSGYRQEVVFVNDLEKNTSLPKLLRQIVGGDNSVSALLCRVDTVNGNTCNVTPLNEKIAPLRDVRLTAFDENEKDKEEEEKKQHWRIIPKEGSKVLVAKINHSDAYVAMFSEIDTVRIKNEHYSLKQAFDDLIEAIAKLTVPTGTGPSGTPVNQAEFNAIKDNINQLLEE